MPHVMTIDGAPVPVTFQQAANGDPYQRQLEELKRSLRQWQVGTLVGGVVTFVALVALVGSR